MKRSRNTYLRFAIAALLYSLFVIWIQVYWLLGGLLLIMDYYITRLLPVPQIQRRIKIPRLLLNTIEWLGAIIIALLFVIVKLSSVKHNFPSMTDIFSLLS